MDKERQQAETALDYLSTSDLEVVELERLFKDKEQIYKETKDAFFMTAEGNIEQRKAEANTSDEAKNAWQDMMDAWQEWKNMAMRRASAERRWEDWRSLNASRRQGGV